MRILIAHFPCLLLIASCSSSTEEVKGRWLYTDNFECSTCYYADNLIISIELTNNSTATKIIDIDPQYIEDCVINDYAQVRKGLYQLLSGCTDTIEIHYQSIRPIHYDLSYFYLGPNLKVNKNIWVRNTRNDEIKDPSQGCLSRLEIPDK